MQPPRSRASCPTFQTRSHSRSAASRRCILPSSAGAGYVWEAAVDDEAVVEVSTKFQDADAKGAGRPKFGENELLTLRGRAEGRTAVRLVQRRTWEEGVAPIAAHALTVNVAAAEATESGGSK